VLPRLLGPADAMIGFTGHFVLAADISPAAVAARLPEGDLSVPMSAAFLTWVGECIGGRPLTFDALLCALGTGAGPPEWLQPDASVDHPRIARARRYRDDIDVWRTHDGQGILSIGRGVCARWELGFEVAPDARGAGLGRRLVAAACALLPAGTPLWAQIAPGNASSLRAVLAAGFVPVAAEVLFARR
jgi:GNAT superfamily N-acetyltransferase